MRNGAEQIIISDFHKNLNQIGKCYCDTMVDFEKYLKTLDLKKKEKEIKWNNVPNTQQYFLNHKIQLFGDGRSHSKLN